MAEDTILNIFQKSQKPNIKKINLSTVLKFKNTEFLKTNFSVQIPTE